MSLLITSKDQLAEAANTLSSSWNAAKDAWRDYAREAFEKNHYLESQQTTASAIDNLEVLAEMVAQAEREIR